MRRSPPRDLSFSFKKARITWNTWCFSLDCWISARFEAHEIVSFVYVRFEHMRKSIISYPCERETENKKAFPNKSQQCDKNSLQSLICVKTILNCSKRPYQKAIDNFQWRRRWWWLLFLFLLLVLWLLILFRASFFLFSFLLFSSRGYLFIHAWVCPLDQGEDTTNRCHESNQQMGEGDRISRNFHGKGINFIDKKDTW